METDSVSVMELLETLEDLLDNAKTAPFSAKVLIDRDAMYEILRDIRLFLPGEIKQSRFVVDEREKIMDDARQKADQLIKDAEVRISKLVTEHEITKRAQEEADMILSEAKTMSKELRIGAMEYSDGLLMEMSELFKDALREVEEQNSVIEKCYAEKIDEIYQSRQELRNTVR